jgi:hypothetical protein
MRDDSFRLDVLKPVQVKFGPKKVELKPEIYEIRPINNEIFGGVVFRLTSPCGAVAWIGQETLRSLVQSGEAQVVASRSSQPALQGVVANAN